MLRDISSSFKLNDRTTVKAIVIPVNKFYRSFPIEHMNDFFGLIFRSYRVNIFTLIRVINEIDFALRNDSISPPFFRSELSQFFILPGG